MSRVIEDRVSRVIEDWRAVTMSHVQGPSGHHAVVVEGRPVKQVAHDYQVARCWIYILLARYRTEGDAAFEPRSRRPNNSPHATAVTSIVEPRKHLLDQGLDAGAETIAWHLRHHHDTRISRATIHRILTREGHVAPTPSKRSRSSYTRFDCATSASDDAHAGTHVLLLVEDLDIRVIHAATGQILRELTLDPTRDYQPQHQQPRK